jgi:hypothetical protein
MALPTDASVFCRLPPAAAQGANWADALERYEYKEGTSLETWQSSPADDFYRGARMAHIPR